MRPGRGGGGGGAGGGAGFPLVSRRFPAIRAACPPPPSVRYSVGFAAGVAQLVERQLPKLNVAGSSPVSRFPVRATRPLRAPRPRTRGHAAMRATRCAFRGAPHTPSKTNPGTCAGEVRRERCVRTVLARAASAMPRKRESMAHAVVRLATFFQPHAPVVIHRAAVPVRSRQGLEVPCATGGSHQARAGRRRAAGGRHAFRRRRRSSGAAAFP